jgi:hypothetical protein
MVKILKEKSMKTINRVATYVVFVPLLLLLPVSLFAQGSFNGTWRLNLDSVQLPQRPLNYSLANGHFKCLSCVETKTDVEADGQDHPVAGSHYADMANVRVIDAHTVEMAFKLKGKPQSEDRYVIAPDGKSLTDESTYHPEDSPEAVHETDTYTRVSEGPAGSHALAGEWRITKIQSASENSMVMTFHETANSLKMISPTGEGWDAKFDGKEYPALKDPGHTMISLKRIDGNTIEETDTRDGKVVSHTHWNVQPDGKSLKYSYHDDRTGTDTSGVAQRE